MRFVPFALVEWQSRHEPTVEFSLADSGCEPVSLNDVLDPDSVERLLGTQQRYPAGRGTAALRSLIGQWHGADPAEVLVTVGGTEANAVALATLLEPGDHVVVLEPGYGQIPGYAANLGAKIDTLRLFESAGWRPDLELLDRLVVPGTRLIVVTNPNNPVGTILDVAEMDHIAAIADRVGAWLLVDEVHRGTELHTDEVTPTFWGRYDRVVCVGSLSKAFALPGLRCGWLVAAAPMIDRLWRWHDYTTVAASRLSMVVAEAAMSPAVRGRLLGRNRGLIRAGAKRLREWGTANADLVSVCHADATALGLLRYRSALPSLQVADLIRTEASVLVAPGVHFGAEGYLRITHSIDPGYVAASLDRIAGVLATLPIEDRR